MANKRFKDFGADADVTSDPVVFRLYDEDFECYPNVQGKVLLDLVANSDDQDGAGMAKTMNMFFDAVLKPESKDRLDTLLTDPERVVSVETLGEITAWLMEQYSARPTQQPEPSSNGD